jgi:hypothetical protein
MIRRYIVWHNRNRDHRIFVLFHARKVRLTQHQGGTSIWKMSRRSVKRSA